ncbi:hypothetical protein LNV08_06010 [Paucibacter sp. TC2R-5]|uniref:hypothetical protein n=1 Tax=Paucibacter sp. TC2R-5 TaxID=2893555 RepID=UPI0021E4FD13|nr:hypothetical protein [Paucibacter sp. TC2R-5]MCV2358527.1 hypothetical protein [Paucibacter sp. TC2R-5]
MNNKQTPTFYFFDYLMQKTLLALALAAAAIAPAQAALKTGDLAFTSFNADEDGWAMVTLSASWLAAALPSKQAVNDKKPVAA